MKQEEQKKAAYVLTVCLAGAVIVCCIPALVSFLFH